MGQNLVSDKSRTSNEIQFLWENEPFGKYDPSKELVEKRDAFSKHFLNENGSVTAHISAGPINYQVNGQWKTIFHTIVPTANGFENTANSHRTYYPATSSGSIKTILENGSELKDMVAMRMFYEANGQEMQSQNIQSKPGNASLNQLVFPGVYGAGMDLRLTQNTTQRKMDYIIQDQASLGNIPAGADFLVFEEKVELPQGWKAELKDNEIYLIDASGKVQAIYEKPDLYDSQGNGTNAGSSENEDKTPRRRNQTGQYEIAQDGNVLLIKTKVEMSWLLSAERQFPIVVDPTVNVVPNNTAAWTWSVASDGWNYSQSLYGADGCYVVRSAVKFNMTTIPAGSVVSAATAYYNQFSGSGGTAGFGFRWGNSADPVATIGSALYNSMTAAYSTNQVVPTAGGWLGTAFAAAGIAAIQGSIGSNLSCGIVPTGTWSCNRWNEFYTYSAGANRPYITVTYTVPCSTPVMGTLTVNGNSTASSIVNVCPGETINVSQSGFNNYGGTTYFYSDNTNVNGGWAIAPDWEIMAYGGITAANQVAGQTNVNNLASFSYKINSPGLYILHANATSGACTGAGTNRYINVTTPPGDPAVYGNGANNEWNVYAYNASTAYDAGTVANVEQFLGLIPTHTYYEGYYVHNTLSISTSALWANSPSAAPGYQGCTVGDDNHVIVYKRRGFPCGTYTFSGLTHDDAIRIYINGTQVFQNTTCCSSSNLPSTYLLDANSTVEIRMAENLGGSYLGITLTAAPVAAAGNTTVSAVGYTSYNAGKDIDVCPGTPVTITRTGGIGTAYYWAGDYTVDLDDWDYFDNQALGNSFNYTFPNPGNYLIRLHPLDACGHNWNSHSDVVVHVSPVNAPDISADQTVCSGIAPAQITGAAGNSGAGAYTYLWKQSTDNGVTWTNASGTNNGQNYTPPAITSSTLYKRTVTSNGCFSKEGELVTWGWTSGAANYNGGVLPIAANEGKILSSGSSIRKIYGSWGAVDAWTGGALSVQSVNHNGGYVEFEVEDNNKYRMCGLGNSDSDASYTSIEYAMYPTAGATVEVYESGVYKGTFGSYVRGDVFRVAVENNQVKYYKNGGLLYTSAIAPTLPLYADLSLYTPGGGIKHVRILDPVEIKVNASPAAPQALSNISAGPVAGVNGTSLLADANITANSCWTGCVGGGHEAWRGRLFNAGAGTGAWASGNNNLNNTEYLQFDLKGVQQVKGVATQGRGDCCPQLVATYTVQYSQNGTTWSTVPGIFIGNVNQQTVVANTFTPVLARYVRIYPLSIGGGHMSMRADILVVPCAGGSVSMSAELTANANTVRWYETAAGGTALATAQYYTAPSLLADKVFYAESYNSVSGCASAARTPITAQVAAASNSIAGSATATCIVNGNNWVHFLDNAGKLIVSINPGSNNLGSVTAESFDHGPAVLTQACNTGTNPQWTTAALGRSWKITPQFNLSAQIRFPLENGELSDLYTAANGTTHNPLDNLASATAAGDLKMSRYSGANQNGSWADNCADGATLIYNPAVPGGNVTTANGFPALINGSKYVQFSTPGFSEFWLHGGSGASPLPVTLISLSAECHAQSVEINWSTASEQNSQKFIVEKSRDMVDWISVDEQAAAGNSNTNINYSATDPNPFGGVSYYRLVQVDFDGAEEIYGPISVSCAASANAMTVYPNPSKGDFTVEIASDRSITNAEIQLSDLTGKIISTRLVNLTEGNNQFLFSGIELQMGTYIVKLAALDAEIKPVRVVVN